MVKKILLLIVSIILLCSCSTKKEENVQTGDGEDEFFTILSRENSYAYPSLDMVNIKIEGNKSVVLVPIDAVESNNMFYSSETSFVKYDILINNDSDVEGIIDSMVVSDGNVEDSGLVVYDGTYTRYIKDLDNNYINYYYGAAISNGYIYITISYFEEELHEEDLEVLKNMKDVYLMDTLKLPDTVIYDIVEDFEESNNLEDVLEKGESPADIITE